MQRYALAGGEDEASAGTAATGVKRYATIALTLGALGLAAFLLHRTFRNYSLDQLAQAVQAVPLDHMLLATLFAALSYLSLTLFDAMGIRYAGRTLPYPQTALASFLALSIGHTVGLAALSSGMIRYRFYARWGLSTEEIAKVVLFCGVTVGIGLLALGGIGLVLRPDLGQRITGFGQGPILALGAACLALTVAYVLLAAFIRRPLRIRRWSFQLPGVRLALGQVAIGTLNFLLVAACLHQSIAAMTDLPFLGTAAIFVIANATTLISHVPGGLGVIESVVLHLVQGDNLIGGLIAFRCLYFFVPLLLGAVGFAVTELVIRARGAPAAPA